MYVKYCENKPKSEYIVAEYIDFFEVMRDLSFPSMTKIQLAYIAEIVNKRRTCSFQRLLNPLVPSVRYIGHPV